jgi:DNA (cytosine-5)-methyltransferase 1
MNHKDKLLEIYNISYLLEDIEDVDKKTKQFIKLIGDKINTQKGVFTVLVTLITHKILHPIQDIRKHQTSMNGGFSGRSIDFSLLHQL